MKRKRRKTMRLEGEFVVVEFNKNTSLIFKILRLENTIYGIDFVSVFQGPFPPKKCEEIALNYELARLN